MIKKIIASFSLRDFLLLFGFGLLAHGLYLLYPWLAYTVCGILLLVGGFFMKAE